jgi:hypothetical protein
MPPFRASLSLFYHVQVHGTAIRANTNFGVSGRRIFPILTVGQLNSESAFAETLREAQSVTCLDIQNLKTGHREYAIRHKPLSDRRYYTLRSVGGCLHFGFCCSILLLARRPCQTFPFLPGRFSGSQMLALFHGISTS